MRYKRKRAPGVINNNMVNIVVLESSIFIVYISVIIAGKIFPNKLRFF